MKKMMIASFFTALVLILPLTSISGAENIVKSDGEDISELKILVESVQINTLKDFINSIEDDDVRQEARDVLNYIITKGGEVSLQALSEMLEEYNYEGFVGNSEDITPVQQLLDMIIQMIQERLGWVMDFVNQVSTLVNDVTMLINDASIPGEIIAKLQSLKDKLTWLKDLAVLLMECQFWEIIAKWVLRIQIIQGIMDVVKEIQGLIAIIGGVVSDVTKFIGDIEDFTQWFNSEPWKADVRVYGQVLQDSAGVSDVDITCRGVTCQTDSEGNFDFLVPVNNQSNISIPPNQWYGLHSCIITVEKDGEVLFATNELLSYCFSDGQISWTFTIEDEKSKEYCFENSNRLFDRILDFLPANFLIYKLLQNLYK